MKTKHIFSSHNQVHSHTFGCVSRRFGRQPFNCRNTHIVQCKHNDIDNELQIYLQSRKDAGLEESQQPGAVYLVGTGPGDPGLVTLRALQLLQQADVVLYDRLVSSDILSLVRSDAVHVYVGKREGFHTRKQSEIHYLMGQFASKGALVVRLKGGDPYIFGRGGEELLYLKEMGIPTYCIPGITAASGICSELGIPLTHRGVATSVRYLTGHSRDGGEDTLAHTTALSADPATTLVVYMGLKTFPTLAQQLIDGGLPPKTPVVAVERGTTVHQRAVYGTIEDLPRVTKEKDLKSPTLIVIGEVVGLSEGWERMMKDGVDEQVGLKGEGMVMGQGMRVREGGGVFGTEVRGALEEVRMALGRGEGEEAEQSGERVS